MKISEKDREVLRKMEDYCETVLSDVPAIMSCEEFLARRMVRDATVFNMECLMELFSMELSSMAETMLANAVTRDRAFRINNSVAQYRKELKGKPIWYAVREDIPELLNGIFGLLSYQDGQVAQGSIKSGLSREPRWGLYLVTGYPVDASPDDLFRYLFSARDGEKTPGKIIDKYTSENLARLVSKTCVPIVFEESGQGHMDSFRFKSYGIVCTMEGFSFAKEDFEFFLYELYYSGQFRFIQFYAENDDCPVVVCGECDGFAHLFESKPTNITFSNKYHRRSNALGYIVRPGSNTGFEYKVQWREGCSVNTFKQ